MINNKITQELDYGSLNINILTPGKINQNIQKSILRSGSKNI
jgi:hypothetical protein